VPTCASCGKDNPADARFCLACGSPLAEVVTREVRKTVTVLFCDVAGSTALGERMDPEALRRVMTPYFEAMKAVVERHGGTVEKFIGDAVMAVFGIPAVHEDDALRAVRSAVEMREVLDELNETLRRDRGTEIDIRIGVNTGQVVAGDPSAGQGMVTGDAVNVAARLEQAASPGEILIGRETHVLVRQAVIAEPVDPIVAKGQAEPVPAFRLLAVGPAAEGFVRRVDSPLVGREHEGRFLSEAFARCVRERACHLFTVLGSPGVGKSRLAEEFARSVESDAIVLRGRCLPYGDGITFWPVAEIVRQAAGIRDEDAPDVAGARIAGLVTEAADAHLITDRLAQMAGLLDDAATANELFWALRRLLEVLAGGRPVVVQFDDIHWAEPTLLDLIEHVADWSRDAPILLLCLARPELLDRRPAWGGGKMNATSLLLEPLTEEESGVLVGNLLGKAELPGPARLQVVRAAEGNPLFVEQMLSMLIDEGLLQRDDGHWIAAGDLSTISVPPTIHALLAARLDRLGNEERAVIERASVVGKVFYSGAVVELAPEPIRLQVGGHLMTLVRKELIRPDHSDVAGEDAFRFRHMLIRDAAYESMPKEARADLHDRFAAWLERTAGARASEFEEILGYHLEQAYRYGAELGPVDDRGRALAARAAGHLASSGRRAMNRGDSGGAARLLERAADLLPESSAERVQILPFLAETLVDVGEWHRADQLLGRAIEESVTAGNRAIEWRARAEQARVRTHITAAESDEAHGIALEAIRVLEAEGDHYGAARAWFLMGEVRNIRGQQASSLEALLRAVEHAQQLGDVRLEIDVTSWAASRMYFGPTRPEEGIRHAEDILARLSGHRLAEAAAFRSLGRFRSFQGRFDEARAMVERALAIAEELGLTLLVAMTRGFTVAPVELLAGNLEGAEREFRACVETCQRMGELAGASTAVAVLGDVLYKQGRYEEAMQATRQSEEWSAPDDMASQMKWRSARAKILASEGRADEAIRLGSESFEMAKGSDFGWRGDEALSFAEVLRIVGRPDEAIAAARQSLAWFEEKGNEVSAGWARSMITELEAEG
jgi:class 3 adenylate cyclase/tetratricopeptide (TPR) repeat protein